MPFLPLPAMWLLVDQVATSTSRQPTEVLATDTLPLELWRHGAEVGALVQTECDAGLG
jgi:hypothetical protein